MCTWRKVHACIDCIILYFVKTLKKGSGSMDPVSSLVVGAVNCRRPDPDGTGRRTLGNERYSSS
jgi:hypothetical protein